MSAKNTLEKIAGLLNVDLAEETQVAEVALESMKLENGTTIQAEKFEKGESVFIMTEDEKVALPVGKYELENGMMLVVAEEGIIADMMKEEKEEEASAELSEEEVTEEVEMADEEDKKEDMAYATKRELAEAVDEVKKMVEEVKAMMEKKDKKEKEETKMSAQEPAAKPIKANPEESNKPSVHRLASNRRTTTLDRVLEKMANYK